MEENSIINKQCQFCGEYIPKDSKICEYCGERLNEEEEKEITETEETSSVISNSTEDANFENTIEEETEETEEIEETETSDGKNKKKTILVIAISAIAGIVIVLGICFFMHKKIDVGIAPNKSEKTAIPHIINKGNTKNLDKAKQLYKDGKIDEAAQIFQDEIDAANDPVAYYYLGEIYNDGGYTKIAISNYKKALEYKKNFYEAQKRLAQMYLSKYENDTALNYATNALKQKPNDVELLKTLADIYYNLDDEEKLRQTHQKIASLDKKDYSSNYYMAYYYYNKDEYKEAIPYLSNLVANNYNSEIAYNLAISYAKIEYYTKAIETLDIIIKKDPYEYYSATYAKSRLSDMKDYYNSTHKKSSPSPVSKNSSSQASDINYNEEAENDLF
jgi:tetratricopeptide (TPR) repeat protein/RNA polymerase subunit RPABC4/transcription elongation factor Spt4